MVAEAARRLWAPLRVGIVGAGNMTRMGHLPAYAELADLFRVVALADPSAERRAIVGDEIGLAGADRHPDARELVHRSDVDVVHIVTPQQLHLPVALAAIAEGKHVLCEKPIATTPADGWRMVAAARDGGVTLGVVHNYLFRSEIQAVLEAIRSGRLGTVEVAVLQYLGLPDIPGVAAFRPAWRHDLAEAGGGVLLDMIHLVYVAEAILGAPIARASGYAMARSDRAQVEDLALCRFETASNVALVNVGWGVGPGGMEISGTSGRLSVRFEGGATSPFVPVESITLVDGDGAHPQPVPPASAGLVEFLADFGRAVLDGRSPSADGEAGARTLETAVAVYASAATGRVIELPLSPGDPVREQGAAGVSELDLPAWSPVRTRGLFSTAKLVPI